MATLAGQRQEHDNESHRRNRDAEEQHARKHVWGYQEPEGDDDMQGSTFLGDVTVQNPKQSNLMPALLAMAGAGVAGYFINQALTTPTPPAVGEPAIDTSVTIGLGRIEDYVSE